MSCAVCNYYYDCPLLTRFKNDRDGAKCEWRKVWEGMK